MKKFLKILDGIFAILPWVFGFYILWYGIRNAGNNEFINTISFIAWWITLISFTGSEITGKILNDLEIIIKRIETKIDSLILQKNNNSIKNYQNRTSKKEQKIMKSSFFIKKEWFPKKWNTNNKQTNS